MDVAARVFKHVQLANIATFGAIGAQLLLVPIGFGMISLDYFPLGGISFVIVFASWLGYHYHFNPGARVLLIALNVSCTGLGFLWLVEFSGPWDRMLQVVLITFMGVNGSGILANITSGVRARRGKVSPARDPRTRGKRQRAIGLTITGLLAFSAVFAVLATFDFFQVYVIKAPVGAMTRSSFWGPPNYNRTRVSAGILPINETRLEVTNASLSASQSNLRPGSFMYAASVVHPSTPGVNYCNYTAGARSFPNGTVLLSSQLPNLAGVTIEFYYMENVHVMEYLVQANSRIITSNWGGNQSWIDSPNLFHAIETTYEYLLLEYWNISYWINIGVVGFEFPHVFNYSPFAARGLATLRWINASRPHLDHCLGISYDFEKGNAAQIVGTADNPDRPYMGENPFPCLTGDKGWYESNEQSDAILEAARAAYFTGYDYAASVGLSVYVVYQHSAMFDYGEGDIDITRLPMWRHPACEYGMMSYMDGFKPKDALWPIYKNVRNQIAVYGDQGRTILNGWIDPDPASVYSRYYTSDEAGFQRYIRDAKVHQACGIVEIFHGWLAGLQQKWGDEAILRLHEALNVDPKEEFTFQAKPWNNFDTELNDIVENFNKPWAGVVMLVIIVTILATAFIDAKRITTKKNVQVS